MLIFSVQGDTYRAFYPELQSKFTCILNFTALSMFMVLSAALGTTNQIPQAVPPKIEESNTVYEMQKEQSDRAVSAGVNTEKYVRSYFQDIPIMVQIARCESHFRQLDTDGDVHRGVQNNKDVGVMQINEFYHLDQAKKKNYDIYTVEGNTAYARDLYERQGTQPWSSSKPCWGKYENASLAMAVK